MIHIEKAVVGAFQVNCFVIWGSTAEALIVDPGGDTDLIREILSRNDLGAAAYILTHGHVDHIAGLEELYDTNPAPIAIHPDDASWAFSATNNFPPFYDAPHKPADVERLLVDDQEWNDSGLSYRVITTPGHSPGSVCLYFKDESTLICGDTLFQGSVGRTDLPGGDSRELTRSLRKLAVLPDETRVYTGHGPDTTMGDEKKRNYFMQAACQSIE